MGMPNEQLIRLYTRLVRTKMFDQAVVNGIAEGKVLSFFHSARGHEAVGVGACSVLRQDDYVYIHHRGHGFPHVIGKGAPPVDLFVEHFGKIDGACRGCSGFHAFYAEHGLLGFSGALGSGFSISVGWALAAQKNKKEQVVLSFFGDGASNRGNFHEAMNMAAVWKLPIVWICENNLIAQFVPIKDAYPREDIANMALAYDIPGVVVDGMDVKAVYEAVSEQVAFARAGKGPSLVECKCYRYHAHSEGREDWEHAVLRSQEEIEEWRKRDPVQCFQEELLARGVLTPRDVERINGQAVAEVEEARRLAEKSPIPDASILDECLYAA